MKLLVIIIVAIFVLGTLLSFVSYLFLPSPSQQQTGDIIEETTVLLTGTNDITGTDAPAINE